MLTFLFLRHQAFDKPPFHAQRITHTHIAGPFAGRKNDIMHNESSLPGSSKPSELVMCDRIARAMMPSLSCPRHHKVAQLQPHVLMEMVSEALHSGSKAVFVARLERQTNQVARAR